MSSWTTCPSIQLEIEVFPSTKLLNSKTIKEVRSKLMDDKNITRLLIIFFSPIFLFFFFFSSFTCHPPHRRHHLCHHHHQPSAIRIASTDPSARAPFSSRPLRATLSHTISHHRPNIAVLTHSRHLLIRHHQPMLGTIEYHQALSNTINSNRRPLTSVR
ncbi:hypothetical protein EPI10_024090 [Gossypium australe]|uniref:Uncharacterized protein n=1 Tax=Gossypium australe TaxID=47621 RepID=A0A5B6VXS0_9ROSI|nr:hypothetical protein EPI10_024090 [Gossypium australe]